MGMPPRDTLLKWKDSLQRENNAGQECVIQGPFGAYSTESIDTLLRLHKANAIKTEVTKELAWFKSSTPTPGMVAEHPSPTSIAKFKTLIHSTQYDQYIPGFGMDPDELSRICCNRWLSCDHILWVVQKLNSMQSSTMCCYLNYAGNVKRFVTRRLPVGTPKPSSLLFILNVGKSSNGSVYMGDNVQQGNHWSICYLDKSKKTVTYADSLAYNVPANLRQKVLEFHREIYGEEMGGFTYTKCHDHTASTGGKCGVKCARSYPLQTCGSVCGLVAVTSAALACLENATFQNLINIEECPQETSQLSNFFFKTPTRYAKYLRLVLATWFAENTIKLTYICPNPKAESLSNNFPSKDASSVSSSAIPPNIIKPQPVGEHLKVHVNAVADSTKNHSKDACTDSTQKSKSKPQEEDNHQQVKVEPAWEKDNHQQMKVGSAQGKDNHQQVKVEGTHAAPERKVNSSKSGPSKIHKCPHCPQTCNKLFNLRRHITRHHKNIDGNSSDKENIPMELKSAHEGRCFCLDCEYRCHKIKVLREHLEKCHNVKFQTENIAFETDAGTVYKYKYSVIQY